MFITNAHAADTETDTTPMTSAPSDGPAMPQAPSVMETFAWNMVMVLVLVMLFYMLMIKPQQKRFREHSQMLSGLKKGDKVVIAGGLIGAIDKIGESDEVVIDLGNGVKVTALRSSIQAKDDPLLRQKAANDAKKDQKNEKK